MLKFKQVKHKTEVKRKQTIPLCRKQVGLRSVVKFSSHLKAKAKLEIQAVTMRVT